MHGCEGSGVKSVIEMVPKLKMLKIIIIIDDSLSQSIKFKHFH